MLLSLTLFSLTSPSCTSAPTLPFPQQNHSASSHSSPYACDLPFKSINEAIENGYYSFAYGTILSTEPVLDTFNWNPAAQEKTSNCEADIDPALRIRLRLEDATWDWSKEPILEVGTLSSGFVSSNAKPYVEAGTKDVLWSDGGKYFSEGDQIGVFGAFAEEGYYLVLSQNFFTVSREGKIENFRRMTCLDDDLNGRTFDELVKISHAARKGEKVRITPPETSPLYSRCVE